MPAAWITANLPFSVPDVLRLGSSLWHMMHLSGSVDWLGIGEAVRLRFLGISAILDDVPMYSSVLKRKKRALTLNRSHIGKVYGLLFCLGIVILRY